MTAPLQVGMKLSRRRDGYLTEITGVGQDGKYSVRGFLEPFTAEQIESYFHIISDAEYAADMAIKDMPKEIE